jgi:hypothetical protein
MGQLFNQLNFKLSKFNTTGIMAQSVSQNISRLNYELEVPKENLIQVRDKLFEIRQVEAFCHFEKGFAANQMINNEDEKEGMQIASSTDLEIDCKLFFGIHLRIKSRASIFNELIQKKLIKQILAPPYYKELKQFYKNEISVKFYTTEIDKRNKAALSSYIEEELIRSKYADVIKLLYNAQQNEDFALFIELTQRFSYYLSLEKISKIISQLNPTTIRMKSMREQGKCSRFL